MITAWSSRVSKFKVACVRVLPREDEGSVLYFDEASKRHACLSEGKVAEGMWNEPATV